MVGDEWIGVGDGGLLLVGSGILVGVDSDGGSGAGS